jgi:hypothetical protein
MKIDSSIERYRERSGFFRSQTGDDFGLFVIPGPCGTDLKVIFSSGDPTIGVEWQHASVSTRNRCPNWQEMCFVKELLWDPEETVMQLHPPRSQWINNHPFVLHLWKPNNVEIPLPPPITVGHQAIGTLPV